MSRVTNLMITWLTNAEEDVSFIKKINHYFREGQGFLEREDDGSWYGGTKMLECALFIGAFNYLDLDDFLNFLRTIEFPENSDLQVIVKEQHDDLWRICNVNE